MKNVPCSKRKVHPNGKAEKNNEQTNKLMDKHTNYRINIQNNGQTGNFMDEQTNKGTNGQTNWQTDILLDR